MTVVGPDLLKDSAHKDRWWVCIYVPEATPIVEESVRPDGAEVIVVGEKFCALGVLGTREEVDVGPDAEHVAGPVGQRWM